MPIKSTESWADPTDDISEDSLENKAMWTYHKPENFKGAEAYNKNNRENNFDNFMPAFFKKAEANADPFTQLRKFQSKVGRDKDIIGQEKVRQLIGKHLVMGEDNKLEIHQAVSKTNGLTFGAGHRNPMVNVTKDSKIITDLSANKAMTRPGLKSLAFGVNSQSNPGVKIMADGRPLSELEDKWGDNEQKVLLKTAQAMLDYMLKYPPPVKIIPIASEFCRIVPEWAVLANGDICTTTFVDGVYNRWGNAPSIYCCPVEGNDFKTLKEAIFQTTGKDPKFESTEHGDIKIPHHLIIEMIHNYMANLGIDPLYWGYPKQSLRLIDFSFSNVTGKNAYLDKMSDDEVLKKLLSDCYLRGLVTVRRFNELIVNKMDSKPILDLFGWFVTKNFIKDPTPSNSYAFGANSKSNPMVKIMKDLRPISELKDKYFEKDKYFDGIYFAGSNAKRNLDDKESFKNHFVLFGEKSFKACKIIGITKRLVIIHNKESDLWSVDIAEGTMEPSKLKESLRSEPVFRELKKHFLQRASSSEL